MDKPASERTLLSDMLRQIDEARNAIPHTPQQPSGMVAERNARLADQAGKIAALKQAREAAAHPSHPLPAGQPLPTDKPVTRRHAPDAMTASPKVKPAKKAKGAQRKPRLAGKAVPKPSAGRTASAKAVRSPAARKKAVKRR